jgi:sugar-specific transcriptional regulator TrmB
MSDSDLQTLTDLGLILREAKVYSALLKSGSSKVSTISKLSMVARPDVYRTLNRLQELGLVEKIVATPFEFKAVPLDIGLQFLLKNKAEEYNQLKVKTKLLLREFKPNGAHKAPEIEGTQFVLIPQGAMVVNRIDEAIESAQSRVDFFLSWKNFSRAITTIFAEGAQKARSGGVRFNFVVEDPEDGGAKELATIFCRKNPAFQLRFVHTHPKTEMGIFDGKQLFIIVNPQEELPHSPVLWSNNKSLLELAQGYFDGLWLNAFKLHSLAKDVTDENILQSTQH